MGHVSDSKSELTLSEWRGQHAADTTWPFWCMGQRQLAYTGHARTAPSAIHLPKQPRVLIEASSLLFSGAEKSYSDLAAKQLIFNSPAGFYPVFAPVWLGAAGLKPPWWRCQAEQMGNFFLILETGEGSVIFFFFNSHVFCVCLFVFLLLWALIYRKGTLHEIFHSWPQWRILYVSRSPCLHLKNVYCQWNLRQHIKSHAK